MAKFEFEDGMVRCLKDLHGDILTENNLNSWDYALDDFIEDVRYACDYLEETIFIEREKDD